MYAAGRSAADLQKEKRTKASVTRRPTSLVNLNADVFAEQLASSYTALIEEFEAKDLHTVGNYSLGKVIGKGSFGKVYLGTHKLTSGSKVVLKSTKKDDANLAREVHHHRQFIHPHIARLYEVIVTEATVWLVLEFCPGDELYHYLTRHGPIEVTKAQKIFSQLVGAVSYVHNKSCVHRDLKLENILLDKNEDVKLVDFGFTREYEGKASYLQTWCGTVCYSAPEMLKGEKYAGEKVDVWSLGVILYALLCGELPFDEDDENATKAKILKDEPRYPVSLPAQAKDLIASLLAKRPILRPSLADILQHPWLAEFAPQQQAILKLQQPAPFTTQIEKDCLQRMRGAGIDIDVVIETVLSQRCDSLAGWWTLLVERENRKEKRRQRKRKEKESEARTSRRISAASGRFDKLAPTIRESPEEAVTSHPHSREPSTDANRERPRTNGSAAATPVLGQLPESDGGDSSQQRPARAQARAQLEKPIIRTTSSPRRQSQQPYRKRNSQLHLVTNNPQLLSPESAAGGRRKKRPAQWKSQLASIRDWFVESARRAKSPNSKQRDTLSINPNQAHSDLRRVSTDGERRPGHQLAARPEIQSRATFPSRPRVYTNTSTGSGRRMSHSPSPLTPQSSYRRNSNLRGRKSTSSSVSSIRTMPKHQKTKSMASSTSSANSIVGSPSLSQKSSRRSPHTSLKALPTTPTTSSFPSSIRYVRTPPSLVPLSDAVHPQSAFLGLGPPSPGLQFATRKRTPFKGPMLGSGMGGRRKSETSASRRSSVQGPSSSTVIREEDEDEDEEVEEVDAFTPESEAGAFIEYIPLGEEARTESQ